MKGKEIYADKILSVNKYSVIVNSRVGNVFTELIPSRHHLKGINSVNK